MWCTSSGTRTLKGAEAELARQLIAYVYFQIDVMSPSAELSYGVGVPLFDRLGKSQQLALLAEVGEALLVANKEPPDLTSLREATVAVLYEELRSCVELEIDNERRNGIPDRFWRGLMHSVCVQLMAADDEESIFDEVPPAESRDFAEWDVLIDCLADRILWDRDWEMEDLFVDAAPDKSRFLKRLLGIDDEYFLDIAPDPNDRQLLVVRAKLDVLTQGKAGQADDRC